MGQLFKKGKENLHIKTTFSFVYTMCDLVQISLPMWLSEGSYHDEYTGSLIISKVNNLTV